MDPDLVASLAERLGVCVEPRKSTYGMSGSHVHVARLEDGRPCVLKATSLQNADEAHAGRRELQFYRDLAAQIPVRTPLLLDYFEDNEALALLLTAHGEIVPATSWDTSSWLSLAVDLARLHDNQIPDPVRWKDERSPVHALREPDIPIVDGFWREDFFPFLDTILDSRELLEQEILRAGEAFVHGDCHTENILRENGDMVWIDWQSTRIGNPAMELAFLKVRATPSGARIPPEMLATYCSERDTDPEQMKRSVIAAELSIFLVEWPAYASFNTPAGQQMVRRRTGCLAERWIEMAGLD